VGALASSITHEFNNILTTAINYAKMGLRHTDEATRTKAFDRILNASQRAAKITTSMLSYSRTSSNRIEPVDLKRLLEEVLVLVQKDLQMHRIQVDVNASAAVWAMASASQIQQLLMNLIINARQAMQENGRLRLIVRDNPADGWAEVVVADSGCGIPQDKLSQIFDSFYTTKKPDDNGQGEPDWAWHFAAESWKLTVAEFAWKANLDAERPSRSDCHAANRRSVSYQRLGQRWLWGPGEFGVRTLSPDSSAPPPR
jgi:signal transduction histidine kinase